MSVLFKVILLWYCWQTCIDRHWARTEFSSDFNSGNKVILEERTHFSSRAILPSESQLWVKPTTVTGADTRGYRHAWLNAALSCTICNKPCQRTITWQNKYNPNESLWTDCHLVRCVIRLLLLYEICMKLYRSIIILENVLAIFEIMLLVDLKLPLLPFCQHAGRISSTCIVLSLIT